MTTESFSGLTTESLDTFTEREWKEIQSMVCHFQVRLGRELREPKLFDWQKKKIQEEMADIDKIVKKLEKVRRYQSE